MLREQYIDFVSKTITMPDSLLSIQDGCLSMSEVTAARPLLVVYTDSASCTSCRIGHLFDYERLFDFAEESGAFVVMMVFSPGMSEHVKVVRDISLSGMKRRLFVDEGGKFSVLNPHIPSDRRFHAFLIGDEGKPIFVGDPTASDSLWELFVTTVTDSSNHN